MTERRKIAIATGTRADWGLLSGIARGLAARQDCEVTVLATNMHLSERYGNTISEIVDDGFADPVRVEMPDAADTDTSTVGAMAVCMTGMAHELSRLRPDLLVILGDRFEMLATATAALMTRVPIVHIAGGEISEGAIDDSIRHAITKMASLHLTATEPYRQRVISMGEAPDRVINTGAIGVYNILHEPLMSCRELEDSIGFSLTEKSLLVTYHPATLDDEDPAVRCRALLAALDRFPDFKVLMTYPNNDPRGRVIIDLIEAYAAARPERVKIVPSLGKLRYLSALRCVCAVVGNSSSGIVEVPSMHIPTVDIGIRQRGRLCGESVIHCGDSEDEIASALAWALGDEGRRIAREAENPYFRPDTLDLIVRAIAETPLQTLQTKKFYDR
ncbi:MAG: UDP-N-acetylglucosamine 2-epimerase (hydrolyzing) [Duncaniella sp.]|uniref:UDP-N-acetylglucosamine 2-epimerase n=1 Tax=Duncaniella sp. TaxID=2518496 RepID=UPI0023BFD656|nr:UDP-N-acetylglucosamine 2-epimerase [Duncaniella sp.]MDE5988890.1 UDP-N-acetylglucosamine 2-epimerase (hydrolyzing) [Duncaniella sp.]